MIVYFWPFTVRLLAAASDLLQSFANCLGLAEPTYLIPGV